MVNKQESITVHNNSSTKTTISDLYPLLAMLVVVVALSALGVLFFSMSPMLAFMGFFFLVFGGLKVVRLQSFVKTYRMYDLLARRSVVYAYAYPFLELSFAVAYLLVWQVKSVSIVVLVVMLISAWGVYLKLRAKEEIPCACLGTVFKVPMTWVTLGEDLLMAVMAAFLLF